MAKEITKFDLSLRSFYIFNSKYGSNENEEDENILYYYPEDIDINTKIRDVGLSKATIDFSSNFSGSKDDCQSLHTQKTIQIFNQPEEGYWMVMVINVPKEVRTKDNSTDYHGGDVHEHLYRVILKQTYNMFRLVTGTFKMNDKKCSEVGGDDSKHLKDILKAFYDNCLIHSLKLQNLCLLDMLRSVQYLPLNRFLFLRAHNFMHMIRATFPIIQENIFLFNEQVVCSDKLDSLDLYCIHEYLTGTLMNKLKNDSTPNSDMANVSLIRTNSSASDAYRDGVFITGPENDNHSTRRPPKIYIKNENTLKAYLFIVYRVLNASLCLFINADEEPPNDFYEKLHSYIFPHMKNLANEIGDTLTKQSSQNDSKQSTTTDSSNDDQTPKYIFINEQSLKHLTNISFERHGRRIKTSPNNLPTNVLNLIADLHENDYGDDIDEIVNTKKNSNINMNDLGSSFQEVQVKTTNDFWIVKRRCNFRQYYVIIFNSKATLLDVTQEAKRIFDQEITDDVFFDK